MGKPSRQQPVIGPRRDGTLYSSMRAQGRDAKPTDPALPTRPALELYGAQQRRAATRRARLAAMLRRGKGRS